ncbi:MAG: VacJ family lipoprotein, partial [Erysipelotrichia bacterium]|nr:VacJ family lipoprotein [Erysipelotrichia bacterium]
EDSMDDFDLEFKDKTNEVFDPLSGYNRLMTTFNDKLFVNVLVPVANGYAYVVPQTARTGIENFFDNIRFPIRFVNNLLQLKFENASEELGRFLINTLWGLGGFMDLATSELNMKAHKEDFGQTLGFYGVGEGFHIVLPFFGPSNVRDTIGLTADSIVSPVSSMGKNTLDYKITDNALQLATIKAFDVVNSTSLNPNQYQTLKKDALDLYPFLRDIYTQARKRQIQE